MSNHEHSHNSHDTKERGADTKVSKKIGNKTVHIRNLIIGAGIAVAVVGGGVWYATNGNVPPHENQQQSQTQEETPEQREARQKEEDKKLLAAEKSFDERVAEIQLPADLSPEKFREEYIKTLTGWMNEGSGPILSAKIRAGKSIDDIALENAKIYATALFGEDWGDNKTVSSTYLQFQYANKLTLTANKESMDSGNAVSYRSWLENIDGDKVSENLSGYNIRVDYKDNSIESGVSADLPAYAVLYVKYATEDGASKVTRSSIYFDTQRPDTQ